jgi:hypothetical protein
MAEHHAHSISLSDLEKAVTAAVKQLEQQKTLAAPEIGRGPFILGRWIQPPILEAQAKAAAEEITRQVSAKIAGLNAKPFFATHPGGGTTMGMVMHEE